MKHRITSPLLLLVMMLAGGSALLAGCGQKGPLYIPDEAGQTEN